MTDKIADVIKIAAILTAVSRWAGAIAEAEGFSIPEDWMPYWRVLVFILSAGMGVAEGLGIWYVMRAWRNARMLRQQRILLALVIISGVVFIAVQTPWLVSQTKGQSIGTLLPDWGIWLWNAFVSASAFAVAGSVGYAQRGDAPYMHSDAAHMRLNASHDARINSYKCKQCDFECGSSSKLAAHVRWTHSKV